MLLGYVSIKKGHNKTNLLFAGVFACWVYLFLNQGPIYVPLMIAAILTIIAIRLPVTPAIVLVIIASYYARSARWTWGYAPGVFAGMLSLLEIQDPSFKKEEIKALIKPVALGLAGYFGGYLLPAIIKTLTKGNELRLIQNPSNSLTRHPLLWERLWPNFTYPPGIILGIVWAALPVIFLLTVLIIKKQWKINRMQILSIAAVGTIFLTVGIIASTKIGGGSNLHNLDMFLVSLVLVISALVNYLIKHQPANYKLSMLAAVALLIVLVAPVTYSLQNKDRLELPSAEKTNETMNAVQNKVSEYSKKGEILFIDHRQLLTFGLVENVPLVNDYEKKVLMDKAMADNGEYFTQFYEDIYQHRFALIINEPANIITRGSEYSFGEENDAYVKWVTIPLLCAYEPIYSSQATSLELLVPRTIESPTSPGCDGIFSGVE